MLDTAKAMVGRITDDHLRNDWLGAMPDTKRGTCKAWFQSHHGKDVELIQAVVSEDGTMRNGWAPGPRRMDSLTRKGAVLFGEYPEASSREYEGMRVEGVSDDVLVASAPWGDYRQIMIYRATN